MKKKLRTGETKDEILRIANILFSEKGYKKTTLQDIIDKLDGKTKGSIYYYFDSKSDILESLLKINPNKNYTKLGEGDDFLDKARNYLLDSLDFENMSSLVKRPLIAMNHPEMIGEYYLLLNNSKDLITKEASEYIKGDTLVAKYYEEIIENVMIYLEICVGINAKNMTKEKFMKKIHFIKEICEKFEFPLIDNEVLQKTDKLYDSLQKIK